MSHKTFDWLRYGDEFYATDAIGNRTGVCLTKQSATSAKSGWPEYAVFEFKADDKVIATRATLKKREGVQPDPAFINMQPVAKMLKASSEQTEKYLANAQQFVNASGAYGGVKGIVVAAIAEYMAYQDGYTIR